MLAAAGVIREPGQDIDAAARVVANELEAAEMRGRAEAVSGANKNIANDMEIAP